MTPVNTPQAVPQGPSFIQFIQQQQQIQNQIQNINFPPYLQANPTISPLDQRSGLTNNAVKVINLNPFSIGITTIKVPNIINSSLLAPSNTVVSNIATPITSNQNVNKFSVPSITIAPNPSTVLNTNPVPNVTVTPIPTTTVTTINAPSPKPDFSGLSNLLNNLTANQKATGTVTNTPQGGTDGVTGINGNVGKSVPNFSLNDLDTGADKTNSQINLINLTNTISNAENSSNPGSNTNQKPVNKEVLDAQLKALNGVIDTALNNLVNVGTKFAGQIDDALKNAGKTTTTTSTTKDGDKLVTTVRSNNTSTTNNTSTPVAEKDFVSKLTDDFMNFPANGTPQERQKALQDMVKTLTNAQKLGLIPANAKEDLAKLVVIANDPNNPAYKANDTTTIKFYLSSVLSKTSTVTDGANKSLMTATAINSITDPTTDLGKSLDTISNIMQSLGDRATSLSGVTETKPLQQVHALKMGRG